MFRRFALVSFMLLGLIAGCALQAAGDLLPKGTPFVLSGTSALATVRGSPCRIWEAENGETYHLFQAPSLTSEAFDEIIQEGVTSRLVLATRSDLTLDCQIGVIVEVQDVLEVR